VWFFYGNPLFGLKITYFLPRYMGRNNTPTAILDAKGSFIKHPDRKRTGEPSTDRPLGPPPKWLSKEEKIVWKDLAKQSLPGVLMFSDRNMFELLVVFTAQFRSRAPMTSSDRAMMITLSSKFALTPADRSKVTVDKPKDSKLDTFLKRRNKEAPTPPPEPEIPSVEEQPLIN
jgi:phage terminase small subunit